MIADRVETRSAWAIVAASLEIVTDLKARGIAFSSLTEQMDPNTPHGELLFSLFGALAQYERALTRERVMAGLAAAKRRGRQGGPPPMIDTDPRRITAALDGGASKASVCRTFKVPYAALIGTLARIGWAPPARACHNAPPRRAVGRATPCVARTFLGLR